MSTVAIPEAVCLLAGVGRLREARELDFLGLDEPDWQYPMVNDCGFFVICSQSLFLGPVGPENRLVILKFTRAALLLLPCASITLSSKMYLPKGKPASTRIVASVVSTRLFDRKSTILLWHNLPHILANSTTYIN